MKPAIIPTVVSSLAALLLAGCGPDPLIGTWSYSGTVTSNVTMPTTTTAMGSSAGTLSITAATTAGSYVYAFHDGSSGDVCLLNGTLSGSVLTFLPNQPCTFTVNSTPYTAIVTSGTSTLSGGALSPQTIHIAYTFMGSVAGVAVSGTGTEDLDATNTAH